MSEQNNSWQQGGWMQTFTGRQFFLMNPQPADIDIIDIAHALSMQCRYNGHTRRFYSVAEHSVLTSLHVAPENALWGLLHDATEAYVGDMVSPLKVHMQAYRDVEDRVMSAIAARFGLREPAPAQIKDVDTRLRLDERAALMAAPAGDWQIEGELLGAEVRGWEPAEARRAFLSRYAELTREPLSKLESRLAEHVEGPSLAASERATYIPAALERRIGEVIGHDDYAPYVLDGQTAERNGAPDDWHDALVVVEGPRRTTVMKFTMHPDGDIEHYPVE